MGSFSLILTSEIFSAWLTDVSIIAFLKGFTSGKMFEDGRSSSLILVVRIYMFNTTKIGNALPIGNLDERFPIPALRFD